MRLSTTIWTCGNRIDYDFHMEDDTHSAWFSREGKSVRKVSAGELVNYLVPYRDSSPHVQGLIKWLMR